MAQSFGGAWTEEKLDCLKKYLWSYKQILRKNTNFPLIYIDAFAGTGEREDPESSEYREGSAMIALREGEFDEYWFAEKDTAKCGQLEKKIQENCPNRVQQVQIFSTDGNRLVQKIAQGDWSRKRALVFLDPFGTQLEWSTMECIAATKAADVWALVPIGTLNRLLSNDGFNSAYRATLDRFFGTNAWEQELYRQRSSRQAGLFEEYTDSAVLKVSHEEVGAYYLRRLSEIFAHVCDKPLILKNSKGSPIFLLCFAVANPRAKVAIKIAGEIIEKKRKNG